jgi:hypothetical protein
MSTYAELEKLFKTDKPFDVNETMKQGISDAGRKVDSYTGAPVRAALGALQDNKPVMKAFTNQWGEDPDKAPTGRQLVENDPITAPYADTALPLAVDMAADWTNLPLPGLSKLFKAPKVIEAVEKIPNTARDLDLYERALTPASRDKEFRTMMNPEVYQYQEGLLDPKRAKEIRDEAYALSTRPDVNPHDPKYALTPEQRAKLQSADTDVIPTGETATLDLGKPDNVITFPGIRRLLKKAN